MGALRPPFRDNRPVNPQPADSKTRWKRPWRRRRGTAAPPRRRRTLSAVRRTARLPATIRPMSGRRSGVAPAAATAARLPWRSHRRRAGRFLWRELSLPGSWNGIRTRDSRRIRSVLYPSELSKQATCRIRTGARWHAKPLLYPTELTSFRNTAVQARAYAIGNAARTGRALEPVPLEPVVSVLRMAGCRQPAIRVGASARIS